MAVIVRALAFMFVGIVLTISLGSGLAPANADETESIADHHEQHELPVSGSPGHDHQPTGVWPLLLLGAYCTLIILASLAGGWLPNWIALTHTRTEMMMSLVGGLMLGIGLFHMLPHAHAELGSIDTTVLWMMFGLLSMFFLIRTFHFHQHGPAELVVHDVSSSPSHDHDHDDRHEQCGHGHSHHHHGSTHELSWLGVFLGLAIHTLIDGLALGASIQAEAAHGSFLSLFGLGTFLAIVLHKPLDAISISSLMIAGGWEPRWRNTVNAGFALMCPLGAGLFLVGVQQFSSSQHLIIGCGLAFAAGVFLCISLGDLLPEMELHSHNRVRLTLLLILGVAIAYGIGFLEPEHVHSHGGDKKSHSHDGQEDARSHGEHEHAHGR